MTPNQSGSVMRLILGGLFVVGAGLLLATFAMSARTSAGNGATGSLMTTAGGNGLLDSAIRKVHDTTTRSDERFRAIRWIGSTSVEVNKDVLDSFSKGLKDTDPTVRCAIANSIGELGRRANAPESTDNGITQKAIQEANLAVLLKEAYVKEEVASVRRTIVEAAANLNHSGASDLIASALEDKDPSVRETAINAKLSREKRLRLGQMG